jgi:hypothetical protein|tara:strand:- start:63 stop:197 length:135 start_codon:yes stop_codon:yes gene_type:complete
MSVLKLVGWDIYETKENEFELRLNFDKNGDYNDQYAYSFKIANG